MSHTISLETARRWRKSDNKSLFVAIELGIEDQFNLCSALPESKRFEINQQINQFSLDAQEVLFPEEESAMEFRAEFRVF